MKTRQAELIELLTKASDEYYNVGESFLSDEQYDSLERELRSLDPTNPFFLGVGSEVRGDKVKLPFQMPSLDQVDNNEVERWVSDNKLSNEWFVVADKLDGTSIMLVYDSNGRLQIAYSRGNGVEGQDVTRHVKKMKKAPLKTAGKLVVRAEVVMEEELFQKKKTDIEKEAGREFKNSRNFVAGQINSSSALDLFYQHVDIVAYEIILPEEDKTDQYDILDSVGFKTAKATPVKGCDLTAEYLTNYLLKRLSDSPYTLDGLVIDVDQIDIRNKLSGKKTSSRLNPAYAKKFKIVTEDNIAIAKVISVEWNISKDGYIKPTVIIEPTELVGVTIRRATGFNAKFIKANHIGPGAEVEICRSGDVIPFIRKVTKPTSNNNVLPSYDEFGLYHWSANGVDIILDNDHTEMLFQRLVVGMRAIGVEFFAEKTLEKLFEAGYTSISDIIKLSALDNIALLGSIIGSEIMAEKGVRSIIEKLNPVKLETLADGSGVFGRGIGSKKVGRVVEQYNRATKLTIDELLVVDGFSEITAKQFYDKQHKFEEFLNDIAGFYTLEPKKETPHTGALSGYVFVFTGFRDAELEEKINAVGGVVSASVNSKTTHLVAKDLSKQSSKMKKAAANGINVISQQDLLTLIGG